MSATDGIVGSGEYTYRVVADWAKLPTGWSFKDVAAVATDSQDRVYVFNRGEHPMIGFDRDGNMLNSWGEGLFHRAHGLHVGPDETLYCTDDGDHTVRKCTTDGKVLLEIGIPGRPSAFMSGEPFNRCTHTALSPDLDIYVSDGYANARVHKFAPNGKLLFSWGECGAGPGEFNIPHNIVSDSDGWVYVADRENHRVQIFDGNGRYETRSEERRVGKGVDLGGRRIIKKKKKKRCTPSADSSAASSCGRLSGRSWLHEPFWRRCCGSSPFRPRASSPFTRKCHVAR